MKDNMFMALATAVLNAFALTMTAFTGKDLAQVIMAISGLISPFVSIYLLKVYIRIDDPAELTRTIHGLKDSIKTCKNHLKDPNASNEFKQRTRAQLEDFQIKLQNARVDFEQGRTHSVTPIASGPSSMGPSA